MTTSHFNLARSVRWSQLVILGAICSGPGNYLSSARAQDPSADLTPAIFLAKYRQALRELAAEYRDVEIEGVDGNSTQFHYVSSGVNESLRLLREKPTFFDRVFIYTGSRGYRMRRPTPDGAYFLEKLVNSDQIPPAVLQYRKFAREAAYHARGPAGRLSELVDSPEFTVKDVARVTEAGESLVKFAFEYLPPRKPANKGWFLLDPALNWAIRGYGYTVEGKADTSKKGPIQVSSRVAGGVRYKVQNGRTVPTEVWSKMVTNRSDKPFTQRAAISTFSLGRTPASKFTLDTYGLGDLERTGEQVEQRTRYRTIAVAAGSLLVAAILFYAGWRVRRGRKGAVHVASDGPGGEQS